jgi:hypothetical protein
MAKAYTPGLKVSERTTHRARRLLPIPGELKVDQGQVVDANDIVAETFMDGDITPINMANRLSCTPSDVSSLMLKKVGEQVAKGEEIAQSKGIFGMFKSVATADSDGTLEAISSATGQVMIRGASIPVQVKAYLSGTVVEVFPNEGCIVENEVMLVQGIFGIGGETSGTIRCACTAHDQQLTADRITPEMAGAVVIGGARTTVGALNRAREVGAAAVVAGGIDDADLRDFLGYDLGVAITGSEDIGITVVVTEGFGEIAMAKRTFALLSEQEGNLASVNGATQIRAGVMRPEILVPLASGPEIGSISGKAEESGFLEIGTTVRIIRDPYFGQLGEVSSLPPEPQVLGSGSKARVLEVALADGGTVVVPRANVELIEG